MSKEKRTVEIHGKTYETVASRVERFRKEKDYSIETELLQNDETTVDTLRGSQNAQNKSKVNQNG